MKSIEDNAKAQAELKESVAVSVEWTENLQKAYSISDGLQRFLLWLLKWGVIGGALATGTMFIVKHFSKIPPP